MTSPYLAQPPRSLAQVRAELVERIDLAYRTRKRSPWYKITFDPHMPGVALAYVPGKKRKQNVPGLWVVFDKSIGDYGAASPFLVGCRRIEDCHKWIDERLAEISEG